MKKKLLKFLHSYKSICLVLTILVIILLIFNIYITRSTHLYIFSGSNENLTILNGTIYTGFDINRFSAPHVIYNGEEIVLKEFELGYYIDDNPISVIKNEEMDEFKNFKLSKIIDSYEFSFTEINKEAKYFNKKNINNLDKFCFKIQGIDSNYKKLDITIPLDVTKISK